MQTFVITFIVFLLIIVLMLMTSKKKTNLYCHWEIRGDHSYISCGKKTRIGMIEGRICPFCGRNILL